MKRKAVPTPGRRSAQIRPLCSSTMARQIASPKPAPRWNFLKMRSRSPRAGPGRSPPPKPQARRAGPGRAGGSRGGVWRAAFSSRLASTCSTRLASTRTSGRSSGRSIITMCVARRSRRWRSTAPAISFSEPQSRSSFIAPVSSRVICSTLVTSSTSRAPAGRCFARDSRAPPAAGRSPRSASVEADPVITASGVRRSCEIEAAARCARARSRPRSRARPARGRAHARAR